MASLSFTRHPVLFEDESLLIIEKPEGVLSHPNPGSHGSLSAFEGTYDLAERRFDTPHGPLWLIHRLDQDTSGILLAAKNLKSAAACRAAFENGTVEKNYLALVSRKPIPPRGKWRDALMERRTGGNVRTCVSPSQQPNALLHFTLKEYFPKSNLSLLEIALITGKTHQVRVQAAYHGHPVAGDRIYGNFGLNKELRVSLDLRRLFLHAWQLKIRHPSKNEILDIQAPLPEALERSLEKAH